LRGSSRGALSTTSTTPRVRFPRHVARLVVDYFDYAAHPGASARRAARHPTLCRLLRLCRASRCLDMSRGSSRGSSRCSSSTTPPTPCVRVPRHVARLVIRLVIDYFTYSASPVASARRTAHRRLLRLRRASGCLGMSRSSSSGLSHRSSSTTPPTPCVRVPRHIARLVIRLVIDYFTYVARPVASARRAACLVTHRRLLRLAQARRRLLRVR
jgi:hypothetical protein